MCRTFKKRLIVVIILVISIVVLLCVYYVLFQPVISPYLFESTIHTGKEFYTDGSYLQINEGMMLRRYMETIEYANSGVVTNFYYIDNSIHDNPFYGKALHICAIDFQYEEKTYAAVREYVTGVGSSACSMGNFTLYVMPAFTMEKQEIVVALDETQHIVRYSVLSELELTSSADDVRMYFSKSAANLDW